MKIVTLIFIFLAYGLFTTDYNAGTVGTAPDFPTFNAPEISFRVIPDSCSGFADCIEYVGNVLINIVLGVIFVVLLIAALLIFIVQLLVVIAGNAFTGIDGAPPWVNVLIPAMFAAIIGVIIYRSVRKGDTST